MMAVTQEPRVIPTSHDSIPQPNFKISPGYITKCGAAIVEESVDQVKYLGIDILNQENWDQLANHKQYIIDNHRFIYLKLDGEDNSLLGIGIHVSMCKKIEELKLTKILIGDSVLDQTPNIQAMDDKAYDRMLKTYLPMLEGNAPELHMRK